MRNIILFGSPGAGKSTLVELLAECNILYSLVSVGQILRNIGSEDSELGHKVRDTMGKGELLDDFYITELVKKAMREVDKTKPIILDGFPRSLGQVNATDGIFINEGIELPYLVYIKISKEEAIARLSVRRVCSVCKENFQLFELQNPEICPKCNGKLVQRNDDKPEVIEERFELFNMQFEIIEQYFKSRDRYFEIDGTIPKPERVEQLIKIINK